MVRILLRVSGVIKAITAYIELRKMEMSGRDVFEDIECFGIAISVFGGGLFDTR